MQSFGAAFSMRNGIQHQPEPFLPEFLQVCMFHDKIASVFLGPEVKWTGKVKKMK